MYASIMVKSDSLLSVNGSQASNESVLSTFRDSSKCKQREWRWYEIFLSEKESVGQMKLAHVQLHKLAVCLSATPPRLYIHGDPLQKKSLDLWNMTRSRVPSRKTARGSLPLPQAFEIISLPSPQIPRRLILQYSIGDLNCHVTSFVSDLLQYYYEYICDTLCTGRLEIDIG